MEQFKIRQNGFKEIRKGQLIVVIPLLLLCVLAGFAISYFNTSGQEREVNIYPIFIPTFLIMIGFVIYRSTKRQKEIFESYKLTIDDNRITKEQCNVQTISISIADISEIRKNSNGSLTIRGKSAVDVIVIPTQIDNFDKLEQLLYEIVPISDSIRHNESFLQKHIGIITILLTITTIGLMVTVYLCENKIVVSISGILLLIILVFSFVEVQRNKNIDKRIKRGRWWSIIVIISIILVLFYKLFR